MKKPRMLVIGLALTMLLPLGAGAPAFAQPDETARQFDNDQVAPDGQTTDDELSEQDLETAESARAALATETGADEPATEAETGTEPAPGARTARAGEAFVCAPPGEKTPSTSVINLQEKYGAPQPVAKTYAKIPVQPAVVTFERVNFDGDPDAKTREYLTYVAFYDAAGKLTLGSRTVTGDRTDAAKDVVGDWSFTTLKDVAGNDFLITQKEQKNLTMTVDTTGLVHVVAGRFVSKMAYWKSTSWKTPMDMVPSDSLVNSTAPDANGKTSSIELTVTSPHLFTDRTGVVRLMFRSGWSYGGHTFLYHYDPDTGQWANTLGRPDATLLDGWVHPKRAPLTDQIRYNTVDGYYYLAYTWQPSEPTERMTSVNLIRTKDFTTWTSATNASLSLPVRYGESKTLIEELPEGSTLQATNIRVGEDNTGKPTVTYTRTTESGTAISVAQLNSTSTIWRVSTLTPWQGTAGASALALTSGTTATNVNQRDLTISYDCQGESRELTLRRGSISGMSTLVSNAPKSTGVLPESVTAFEHPAKPYSMNVFTTRVESVNPRTGQTILKWEAGKPGTSGALPAQGTYPAEGSTLYISIAAKPNPALNCAAPGDAGVPTRDLSLVREPEPMLDAQGVPAKSYAGFYAEPTVVSTDSIPTKQQIKDASEDKENVVIPPLNRPEIPITYVSFYDAKKVLTVGMRTGSTGPWTFATPRGADGEKVVLTGDSHNGTSMAVDTLGQLHLIANVHSSPMTYWRSKSPETPLEFEFRDSLIVTPDYTPTTDATGKETLVRTDEESAITYPRFFIDKGGVFRLTFRHGWSNNGKIYFYNFDVELGAWKKSTASGYEVLNGAFGSKHSPYPDHIRYNPTDHHYYLAYTWHDTYFVESTSTINLIRTKDFDTWTSVTGKKLDVPIRYGNPDAMVHDVPAKSGLLNSNVKLGFDSRNLPAIAYTRNLDSGVALSIARLTAGKNAWQVSTLQPWTGMHDLSDSSKVTGLLLGSWIETEGNNLKLTYSCNFKTRELTLGNGALGGQTTLLSNTPMTEGNLPQSLTTPEFTKLDEKGNIVPKYKITTRTLATDSDEGTVYLRWEAGAMISNGDKPGERFPEDGSTLLIAVAEK